MPKSPNKIAKLVLSDHTYGTSEISNSEDFNKKQKQIEDKNKKLRSKVKILNQKIRRKKTQIKTLSCLITQLRKENKLKSNVARILDHEFSGLSLELIKNISSKQTKSSHGQHYSDIIKQFAVTLHYHSAKAYEYVRKIIHLPHVSSIRSWCSFVECKPAFCQKFCVTSSQNLQMENYQQMFLWLLMA